MPERVNAMTNAAMKLSPDSSYTEEEITTAFPDIDPGFEPFGSRVIVQLRSPKVKSKGGILFVAETTETELWNTQIAKIRAIGPVAFKNRDSLADWPEKSWCSVGDYVRIPKYNQDKWVVDMEDGSQVLFMLVNDIDLLAKKTGNPLEVKAYI